MTDDRWSEVQKVGNTEWLGSVVHEECHWEELPNNEKIEPSGVENCEDETRGEMMAIAANIIMGVDITEIYSPERVVKVAKAMGLRGGLSFDLTNGWNFNVEEDCEEAWRYITTQKPLLVIGSPMCTMFSALQNLRKKSPE